MDVIKFDTENVLDALSASRTLKEFPVGRNSKWVRNVSFASLLDKGLIPTTAKFGWLNDRNRRKGCTPAQNIYLDGLNRVYANARYFYGEDGKKPKETTDFVSYVRVSTKKQGVSGLGLAAQKKDIGCHIKKVRGNLLGEYTEVGSGADDSRPELMEAIEYCRLTGATLIVAKLDRLSRDSLFVGRLYKSGPKLIVAEYPEASPRLIAELALRAQYDAEEKREITKAALAISTTHMGLKGKQNLHKNPEAAERGRELGGAAMKEKADLYAKMVLPLIEKHLMAGLNLVQVAEMLNRENILTARGKRGEWTKQVVQSILTRAATWLKD